MVCRFVMPFEQACTISVQNLGEQKVRVLGSILTAPYQWNAERSMHFRARWRIDHDITAGPAQDMPYLIARGAGSYVGTTLHLLNPNPIPSGAGNWWGEGDEKIFIDDDVLPSTFGTGSEDYFNYAWGQERIFIHPYCAQPRDDGPSTRGFIVNNRWHILDALPFENSCAFYMELYPHEVNHDMAYARIAYHYGRPGLMDDHVLITSEDVRPQSLPPWEPAARLGAANSVFFQPGELLSEEAPGSVEDHPLASGSGLFRWKPSREGDELRLKLPVAESGKYRVQVCFLLDNRAGQVRAELEGVEGAAKTFELFDPHRTMLRGREIGVVELQQGEVPLVLRWEGSEAGGASVGIDFFWLQKR
jgi:hypothetical protein